MIKYRVFFKAYPKKLRTRYLEVLSYSGIKIKPARFLGFLLFFGIGLSLSLTFIIAALSKAPFILTFIALFILIEISVYFWFVLRADAKGKFVEGILPDVLQLMASNLRAGLTTDRALLLSARPEFGPFQFELNKVGKEIVMGKEITESLLDMSKRIKSEKLEKTVLLIVSGLKAGGELIPLLEQSANSLRRQRIIDEKIRANVMMYVIFIFSAIGFGAPLLFGLSSFLIQVITKNISAVEVPATLSTMNLPLTSMGTLISPAFVRTFAIISLITTASLGSLILGLISKGKERDGIKFIPLMIILTLSVFFLVRFFIQRLIGGLFGI